MHVPNVVVITMQQNMSKPRDAVPYGLFPLEETTHAIRY